MKKHGHYCKVCCEYKANEKFTGKGHAAHICKACSKLPPEKRSEIMILNKLVDLPWRLSKEQRNWLKSKTHDRRPEVRAMAQHQYDLRFAPQNLPEPVYDDEEIDIADWFEDEIFLDIFD